MNIGINFEKRIDEGYYKDGIHNPNEVGKEIRELIIFYRGLFPGENLQIPKDVIDLFYREGWARIPENSKESDEKVEEA